MEESIRMTYKKPMMYIFAVAIVCVVVYFSWFTFCYTELTHICHSSRYTVEGTNITAHVKLYVRKDVDTTRQDLRCDYIKPSYFDYMKNPLEENSKYNWAYEKWAGLVSVKIRGDALE